MIRILITLQSIPKTPIIIGNKTMKKFQKLRFALLALCVQGSHFFPLMKFPDFSLTSGVVADLWPNNSIIMRHFFKNNSRIMQTYNYLFVSIISFVNMNNIKITPNATMCSSIISLFLLITLFTVQL